MSRGCQHVGPKTQFGFGEHVVVVAEGKANWGSGKDAVPEPEDTTTVD